jgi:BlaI family transcriptional regulator, penicillinase repressor
MGRIPIGHPTIFELEILKVLWRRSPQPVTEVRAALAKQKRKLAHTTIITTLNKMLAKKFVKRVRAGRAFDFTPCVSEADVARLMLTDVLNRAFDGSTKAVMQSLLEKRKIAADDLKDLRRLINQKIKDQA